jgi:hypothetical protein
MNIIPARPSIFALFIIQNTNSNESICPFANHALASDLALAAFPPVPNQEGQVHDKPDGKQEDKPAEDIAWTAQERFEEGEGGAGRRFIQEKEVGVQQVIQMVEEERGDNDVDSRSPKVLDAGADLSGAEQHDGKQDLQHVDEKAVDAEEVEQRHHRPIGEEQRGGGSRNGQAVEELRRKFVGPKGVNENEYDGHAAEMKRQIMKGKDPVGKGDQILEDLQPDHENRKDDPRLPAGRRLRSLIPVAE